jgi:hypothetical protein
MSIASSWMRAALVSTTLLAGLALDPGTARAYTEACEISGYFAEDVHLSIVSAPSCVEVEVELGDGFSCSCQPSILMWNRCDEPVIAQGFELVCGCSSVCESLAKDVEGNIFLDVAGKKEGETVQATFNATVGDQELVFNVTYTVGFKAEEEKSGGCATARGGPGGLGWLIAVAGAMALAARRTRRK